MGEKKESMAPIVPIKKFLEKTKKVNVNTEKTKTDSKTNITIADVKSKLVRIHTQTQTQTQIHTLQTQTQQLQQQTQNLSPIPPPRPKTQNLNSHLQPPKLPNKFINSTTNTSSTLLRARITNCNNNNNNNHVKGIQIYPLDDHIYTNLKPSNQSTRFYPRQSTSSSQQNQNAYGIPSDFVVKALWEEENCLLGIQLGRIVGFNLSAGDERSGAVKREFLENCNRQIYGLVSYETTTTTPDISKPSSISTSTSTPLLLAFSEMGTLLRVKRDGTIKILLKDSVPRDSFSKILERPGTREIWVIGRRETVILLVNLVNEAARGSSSGSSSSSGAEAEVGVMRKFSSHFPQAKYLSFLESEEMVIITASNEVQFFHIAKYAHRPALMAQVPAASDLGPIIKIFKIRSGEYVAVHSDGKLIIWRFDGEMRGLEKKFIAPITLYRIQSAHFDKDDDGGILWLGLNNGKIVVTQLFTPSASTHTGFYNKQENEDKVSLQIRIICESKTHFAGISSLSRSGNNVLISIDQFGQLCLWDRKLTAYNTNKLLWEREGEYCDFEEITVRTCSWNVGGKYPMFTSGGNTEEEECLDRWLGTKINYDLLVIGLQEIIDLDTKTTLLGQQNSQKALENWIRVLQQRFNSSSYKLLHSATMVGLGLMVFCKEERIKGIISDQEGVCVKTGLGGLHGNKGALCWRAFIHDTPVAFVTSHLAAGQRSVSERNNDFGIIMRTADFSLSSSQRQQTHTRPFPTANSGSRLFDHCSVIFFGDLNYRVEMERDRCENHIKTGNFMKLKISDQLSAQLERKDLILKYFEEAGCCSRFAPTYKYDPGSVDQFDSSEKRRIPSWCDRILFYTKNRETIRPTAYSSIQPATLSDHKPIYATFVLKCRKIDTDRMKRVENIIR